MPCTENRPVSRKRGLGVPLGFVRMNMHETLLTALYFIVQSEYLTSNPVNRLELLTKKELSDRQSVCCSQLANRW